MKPNKLATAIVLTMLLVTCLLALCGCAKTADQLTQSDDITEQVSFGKKYYALSGDGCDKKQYYQFNKDGTATYNVTLEDNGKVTFKSVINFKWFYAGGGQFIMLHNGMQVLEGNQSSVLGFGRVMNTTKCAMYWDNMYYICEDCVNAIPNYAKFVGNN